MLLFNTSLTLSAGSFTQKSKPRETPRDFLSTPVLASVLVTPHQYVAGMEWEIVTNDEIEEGVSQFFGVSAAGLGLVSG